MRAQQLSIPSAQHSCQLPQRPALSSVPVAQPAASFRCAPRACAVPAGKGDELPGQPAQDIVFVVRQKPHPTFTREGDDLVTQMRIPLRWGLLSLQGGPFMAALPPTCAYGPCTPITPAVVV